MWHVVNFLSDNSVSAVPNIWLKDGYCAWPKPFIKNKIKLIENRVKPGKSLFDFYKVRVLSEKPIEKYSKAKFKALKAQSTSDLSSASEDIGLKGNKKTISSLSSKKLLKERNKIPTFSDSSEDINNDDSDDDKLYVPPSQSCFNKVIGSPEKLNSCKSNLCASPLNINNFEIDDADTIQVINSPVGKWTVKPASQATSKEMIMDELSIDNPSSQVINQPSSEEHGERPVSHLKHQVRRQLLFKNDQNKKINNVPCDITEDDESYSNGNHVDSHFTEKTNSSELVDILNECKKLHDYSKVSYTNIKYDIKHLKYITETIQGSVESIKNILENETYKNSSKEPIVSNILTTNENIPIYDKDSLEQLEKLLESESFRHKIVVELSRLIGKTISESIRRMMQHLFTDNWLKAYSYIGFKGKNKFSSLKSCSIIFDAIRLHPKFENIPDMEISLSISKWMAQANNRLQKKKTNIHIETQE